MLLVLWIHRPLCIHVNFVSQIYHLVHLMLYLVPPLMYNVYIYLSMSIYFYIEIDISISIHTYLHIMIIIAAAPNQWFGWQDEASFNNDALGRQKILYQFGIGLGLVPEHQSKAISAGTFPWNTAGVEQVYSAQGQQWIIDNIYNINGNSVPVTRYDTQSVISRIPILPTMVTNSAYQRPRLATMLSDLDIQGISLLWPIQTITPSVTDDDIWMFTNDAIGTPYKWTRLGSLCKYRCIVEVNTSLFIISYSYCMSQHCYY